VHGLLGRGLRAVGGAKAGELQLRLRWRRFLREKVGRGRRVAGDVAEALWETVVAEGWAFCAVVVFVVVCVSVALFAARFVVACFRVLGAVLGERVVLRGVAFVVVACALVLWLLLRGVVVERCVLRRVSLVEKFLVVVARALVLLVFLLVRGVVVEGCAATAGGRRTARAVEVEPEPEPKIISRFCFYFDFPTFLAK